jgi:hypothetical protein
MLDEDEDEDAVDETGSAEAGGNMTAIRPPKLGRAGISPHIFVGGFVSERQLRIWICVCCRSKQPGSTTAALTSRFYKRDISVQVQFNSEHIINLNPLDGDLDG